MGTHPIFESDFDCLTEMAEEVKTADVEMAEATPEKKPEVKELPIEDIEDLNSFVDDAEASAKKVSINIENHPAYLISNMEKLKADKDTCDLLLGAQIGLGGQLPSICRGPAKIPNLVSLKNWG